MHARQSFQWKKILVVLILIVLDHLIMPAIDVRNYKTGSLNPYCIGSSNHADQTANISPIQ